MSERKVKANGIEIWTEDFGLPGDPPILLVMGASAQGIFWDERFCQQLVAGPRHVIRYDNRDTGQSTCFDFEKDPYTLSDLAADAVGVLDAYGLDSAHLVGASMGGMIGQAVAIEYPSRIRTLTSIMSTPAGGAVAASTQGEQVETDLPPPRPEVIEAGMEAVANPPKTREERIEARLKLFKLLSGTLQEYDEERGRQLFTREYDRARNYEAANNHTLAISSAPDRREALRTVSVPTLVIHGTEDPILPYEHGVATAEAIPGAELLTIEKMGHDLPESAWPRVVEAILRHTR